MRSIVELNDVASSTSVDSNVLLAVLNDPNMPLQYLVLWHRIALDLTAIDHAPQGPGLRQQQVGPARSSRALALVHIAMFEAANAFSQNKYESALGSRTAYNVSGASGPSPRLRSSKPPT